MEFDSLNLDGCGDQFAIFAGSTRVTLPPDVSFKPFKVGYKTSSVNKQADTLSYGRLDPTQASLAWSPCLSLQHALSHL